MVFNNKMVNTEKSWNMAKNFLDRLDRRCDERDIYATKGELLAWYRSLRAIYRNVHFDIKKVGQEEEEEKLKLLFEKAHNYFKGSNQSRNLWEMSITKIEETLDEIDTLLNDLMFEYGLIIPIKRTRNMEAEILEGWFDD